jgi:hypothetical protein
VRVTALTVEEDASAPARQFAAAVRPFRTIVIANTTSSPRDASPGPPLGGASERGGHPHGVSPDVGPLGLPRTRVMRLSLS